MPKREATCFGVNNLEGGVTACIVIASGLPEGSGDGPNHSRRLPKKKLPKLPIREFREFLLASVCDRGDTIY